MKRMKAFFLVVGMAFAAGACAASGPAAEWIAGRYEPPAETNVAAFFAPERNDIVMRTFRTRPAAVTSAVWRVAAPGMRDLFVNGVRVSPTALPPLTPYAKRILEERFDVTREIRPGAENVLRVELGNGWYNPLPLKFWYTYELRKALAVGTPCVRATLELAYADGTRESVPTDGRWTSGQGRVVRNSIYLGVVEDFRAAPAEERRACVVKGPAGRVEPAGDFPKVVVYDRWTARSVRRLPDGAWLVDMGVNFAGSLKATLRNLPAGRVVRFRKGERLHPDGSVNVLTAVAGQIKVPSRGPLFAVAEQRDELVADGRAETVFEPRFAFHVFRYVQVEGLAEAPRAEDFEALAWSADVRETSSFTCSNGKLNRLHEVCRRTFRSNLQGVQSDCPGREKFGYGGDMACTAEAFWCNYDMRAFYRKTVRDFLDEAADDGLITETAPFVGIASRSVYPVGAPRGASGIVAGEGTRAAPIGWAVGVPVLVDLLVRYAGDLETVAVAYPALVRYIGLLERRYPDNDIPECLGDWVPPDESLKADTKMSALAHWHQFVSLTAKFARLLGRTADEARFRSLADAVAVRFRRLYVRDGVVARGVQGDQLFALYHGLLDGKDAADAYGLLKADISARGDSLRTGIFATKYLLEYLSTHGDAELAGKVVAHEAEPGWMHMMNSGATTLWEGWDVPACTNTYSNCHPMFGSVDEWLVRHVLGIAVCDDAVGCDKVRIAPHAVAGVTSASGWLDTPKGRISVSWRLDGGRMVVEKSVPPGVLCREDAASAPAPSVVLAADGRLAADIVLPRKPGGVEKLAAEELAHHLEKAFGRRPVVLTEDRLGESACPGHLYLGATDAARRAELPVGTLADDERCLRTVGRDLFLLGGDGDTTYAEAGRVSGIAMRGTLYAVYDFLEREMGVRWLWPGPSGEVVPRRTELRVADIDRRGVEPLEVRTYYQGAEKGTVGFVRQENEERFFREQEKFLVRQRLGKRRDYPAGHSFSKWWDRYGAAHPEYFNLLPNGRRMPQRAPRLVTMCVSEPGVRRQKVAEWREWWTKAGAARHPPYPWVNCCENDSAGMCTCDRCRSWDGPDPRFARNAYWNGGLAADFDAKCLGVKLDCGLSAGGRWVLPPRPSADDLSASLSDRYVRFYNEVAAEARLACPDAKAIGYAYANYIEPPLKTRVGADTVIIFVPRSYFPYDRGESENFRRQWLGWRRMGAERLVYRPNYMLAGGNHPIDDMRLILDDFAFAASNGMFACQFDSLTGAWSAQAMRLYALTRAMRDPQRGYARARADMLSGFGRAADAVDRYFDLVERQSAKWTFDSYCEIGRRNVTRGDVGGSFRNPNAVLGDFFDEAFFAGCHAALDEAECRAAGDAESLARIAFLRKGLRDTELGRRCRLAQKASEADPSDADRRAAYEQAYRRLADYRASVEGDFVCNYRHHADWERRFLGWPHKTEGQPSVPEHPGRPRGWNDGE